MAINLVDNTAGAGEPLKDGFDKVNQAILLLNSIGNPDEFVRIFASIGADGVTTEDLDGFYTEIPVKLYGSIRTGIDFKIINKDTGESFSATSDENAVEGDVTLTIAEEQYIKAPSGSYVKWDEVQRSAELTVSPTLVQSGVEAERTANSIGTIATRIAPGIPLSTIDLKDIDNDIDVENNDQLTIENKRGFTETFLVSGDQTITSGTYSLAIHTKQFNASYEASYAWVFEAGWKQSAKITINKGNISINASNISGAQTDIAGLELQVGNFDPVALGADLSDLIGNVGSRAYLYASTEVGGVVNLASVELLSGTAGSLTRISGDNIQLNGNTSVLGDFSVVGENITLDGNVTINTTTNPFTVNGAVLVTGSVDADKLNVTSLSAISADLGSVTAGSIVVGSTNKLWLNDAGDGGLAIGGATKASAPFRVSATGGVVADNIVLTAQSGSDIDWDYVTSVAIVNADIVDAEISLAKIDTATITNLSALSADLGSITAGSISVGENTWDSTGLTFTRGEINLTKSLSGTTLNTQTTVDGDGVRIVDQLNQETFIDGARVETSLIRVLLLRAPTGENLRIGNSSGTIELDNADIRAPELPTTAPTEANRLYLEADGSGNFNVKLKG